MPLVHSIIYRTFSKLSCKTLLTKTAEVHWRSILEFSKELM
ncbi:MAG: hypothetical protein ACKERG_02455 [Candidatus Hodgkinia cicadicola]